MVDKHLVKIKSLTMKPKKPLDIPCVKPHNSKLWILSSGDLYDCWKGLAT